MESYSDTNGIQLLKVHLATVMEAIYWPKVLNLLKTTVILHNYPLESVLPSTTRQFDVFIIPMLGLTPLAPLQLLS